MIFEYFILFFCGVCLILEEKMKMENHRQVKLFFGRCNMIFWTILRFFAFFFLDTYNTIQYNTIQYDFRVFFVIFFRGMYDIGGKKKMENHRLNCFFG